MTRSDLLDLVYLFYPRGMAPGGLGYEDTDERCRRREAARRGVAEHPTWQAMIRRLGARYSCTDRTLFCSSGIYDPAYTGYTVIPGHTLGFFVSLLGPCYGIHRRGAPGEEPAALDLAREIEATYHGYESIPPELGNEVVAEVGNGGESTIYTCLLSEEWEWSSRPYPEGRSSDHVELPDDPVAADEPPNPGPADVGRDLPIHWKDRRD